MDAIDYILTILAVLSIVLVVINQNKLSVYLLHLKNKQKSIEKEQKNIELDVYNIKYEISSIRTTVEYLKITNIHNFKYFRQYFMNSLVDRIYMQMIGDDVNKMQLASELLIQIWNFTTSYHDLKNNKDFQNYWNQTTMYVFTNTEQFIYDIEKWDSTYFTEGFNFKFQDASHISNVIQVASLKFETEDIDTLAQFDLLFNKVFKHKTGLVKKLF